MQLVEDAVWVNLLSFSEWTKSLLYVQPGQDHDAHLSLRAQIIAQLLSGIFHLKEIGRYLLDRNVMQNEKLLRGINFFL